MTLPRFRISIATGMMLVVTTASASALAARVLRLLTDVTTNPFEFGFYDLCAVLILGIVLTAVALAARKGHSPNQTMLQITVTCLSFLYAITMFELSSQRIKIYWLQALFGVLVALPLVARRLIKRRLDRGPRRSWWMKTCEAVAFAYLNMLLVLAGVGIEAFIAVSFK